MLNVGRGHQNLFSMKVFQIILFHFTIDFKILNFHLLCLLSLIYLFTNISSIYSDFPCSPHFSPALVALLFISSIGFAGYSC